MIFTIGHANRTFLEFAGLLNRANVNLLVDVRSVPRSRANPQYNESALPQSLNAFQIDYIRLGDLGGFRPKSKEIPESVNGFWQHNSFHSYADYAMGAQFSAALDRLIELSEKKTVAIMCAEMLWWRCHRRIITDYLIARDKEVFHIIGEGNIKKARITAGAKILPSKTLSYPSTKNP